MSIKFKTLKMAAKISLYSSYGTTKINLLPNLPLASSPHIYFPPKSSNSHFRIHAKIGGDESEEKDSGKRKFITKDQEPEQYWQSAGEREGENPMKTPLPYILIFGMSTPFIILAVAFANGWIKAPIR